MNTTAVYAERPIRTISEMMPINLRVRLFERIMSIEHESDWRSLLRNFDGALKRLAGRLRK